MFNHCGYLSPNIYRHSQPSAALIPYIRQSVTVQTRVEVPSAHDIHTHRNKLHFPRHLTQKPWSKENLPQMVDYATITVQALRPCSHLQCMHAKHNLLTIMRGKKLGVKLIKQTNKPGNKWITSGWLFVRMLLDRYSTCHEQPKSTNLLFTLPVAQ